MTKCCFFKMIYNRVLFSICACHLSYFLCFFQNNSTCLLTSVFSYFHLLLLSRPFSRPAKEAVASLAAVPDLSALEARGCTEKKEYPPHFMYGSICIYFFPFTRDAVKRKRENIKYTNLRMDNAKSLCSNGAKKYYTDNKIIFQTCSAGKDDHAHRAESAIKTIQRMALSSLFGAKLDVVFNDANGKQRSLFTYALDMAVATKRHLPYAGNNHMTPFEAIRGRKPTKLEIDNALLE